MSKSEERLEIVAAVTLAEALEGLARLLGSMVPVGQPHLSPVRAQRRSTSGIITQQIPIWRD